MTNFVRRLPFLALWVASCAPAASTSAPPSHEAPGSPSVAPDAVEAPSASQVAASVSTPAKLEFSRDDFAAAMERARRAKKLVFVDAWAEWCHTCLSMDSVVLSDPSLVEFSAHYEFVALDTEQPQNEAFTARHKMDTWPTFFVFAPQDESLIGYWPGAGSVREMREFLEQSLDAASALQGGLPPHLGHLLEARRAHAEGNEARAVAEYGKAYDTMPADWSRRSEVQLGYIDLLSKQRKFERCTEVGKKHLDEITGAAKPAQFAQRYFSCLSQSKSPDRDAQVERALGKLRTLARHPNADMAFDDQVDALSMLATAYSVMGRKQEAAEARAERLRLAEEGAKRARDALEARAFDRVRVTAYLELGRAEEALRLLEESERAHPHGYATPALLADVHRRLGRHEEGISALERAIAASDGPRRCDYLEEQADWLGEIGRRDEELRVVERLIEERAKLPGAGQAQKLHQARQRRDRLAKALGR